MQNPYESPQSPPETTGSPSWRNRTETLLICGRLLIAVALVGVMIYRVGVRSQWWERFPNAQLIGLGVAAVGIALVLVDRVRKRARR